ncbi:MAG: hypothetical protein ACPGXL_08425 [Chitinophagales bacterium]
MTGRFENNSTKRDNGSLPANKVSTDRISNHHAQVRTVMNQIDTQSLREFISDKLPRKQASRKLISSIRAQIKKQN